MVPGSIGESIVNTKGKWPGLVLAALLGSGAASAHHSAAPHFDLSTSLQITGTVTAFRFVNPHSYVYLDVAGADGHTAGWRCELPSRTALERRGWTVALFPVGRKVRIEGSPARREAQVCYTERITTEAGRAIGREADLAHGVNPLASGQAGPAASERSARDAWGHPNLAGLWVAHGRPFRLPPGALLGAPQPTAAGVKAARDYDPRFDDPALQCSPANILFGWTHDQNVNQITQARDAITLRYGYMDAVRVIHLDAVAHPPTPARSVAGHSIGRWEGEVLVVDTVGFQAGVLVPMRGLMHSELLHVIERFSVDLKAGTLKREYSVDDALYLQHPYQGSDVLQVSDEPYRDFGCVELSGKNNLRTL